MEGSQSLVIAGPGSDRGSATWRESGGQVYWRNEGQRPKYREDNVYGY